MMLKNDKIKIGRNDPCPCGSGKKYKRCCLNAKNPKPVNIEKLYRQKYDIRLKHPKDIDGMAKAIWSVLTDSALREGMTRRGYRQAQKFSWDKAAKETLQLYLQADGKS